LSERQRATAVGMKDFIIKPFDATVLIESVMRHAVGARIPATEVHSAPPTATGGPAWPAIDGIDMQDARNRLCDDPALFRSLLQRLLDDFVDIAVPSSRAVPPGLAEQAGRLHKLKGTAGILGAKNIQHLADGAEAACKAGDGALAGQRAVELVTHLNALRLNAARAFGS
jgi:hypothetical protein